jgi:small subunit ribosomal protein S1
MQDNEENQECMIRDEEGNLVPDYDQTIKVFEEGDIVSGKVVKVDRDEVLVDIGYKSEGVIPLRELSIHSNVDSGEIVTVGEEIDALVLQKEDNEGRLILSKKRAEFEKAWDNIEELCKEEKTIAGKAIEIVKGGLILDIGLRGFLPASLVDLRRVRDLNEYLGQQLECRIIEMNRARNNVVLSRRAVLEDERKAEKLELLAKLQKGQVLTGKVSSLVDFGAFVDLGGIDGLIHISELSWTHINEPSEVVAVGDEIKVQVLDVDMDRERISLGYKQTQEDPWREQVKKFNVGDVIEGKVTKIVPFGVFVQMTEGVEALVHISELAKEHVEMPEQVVKVGDIVKAKIVDIDLDRRRVSLSIKRVLEEAEEEEEEGSAEPELAEEAAMAEAELDEETAADESEEIEESEQSGESESETADLAEAETEEEPEPEAEIEEEPEAETKPEEPEPEAETKPEEPEAETEEEPEEPAGGKEQEVASSVETEEEPADEKEEPVASETEEAKEKMEMAGTEKAAIGGDPEVKELAAVETRYEDVPEQGSLESILKQMKAAKSQDKSKDDDPPLN